LKKARQAYDNAIRLLPTSILSDAQNRQVQQQLSELKSRLHAAGEHI
jgi:hypothetical protein